MPTAFAEELAQRPDELAERAVTLGSIIIAEILAGGGEEYLPFAGQSVGLMRDIRSARDIIRQTMEEAEQILYSLTPASALRTLRCGSSAIPDDLPIA